MKYLIFIVLLVAVVISAGCVGEKQNTVVTPSQTSPTTTILVNSTVPTAVPTTIPTPIPVYHLI